MTWQKSQIRQKIVFCIQNILVFGCLGICVFAQENNADAKPSPNSTQASVQAAGEEKGASAKENSTKPDAAKTAAPFVEEELIHLGDVIDVDVLGSIEYDWRGTLDSEGFLSALPYTTNSVFALCATETEAAAAIVSIYTNILRNPQIIVRIVDRSARQQARLLGAIRAPSRLQIERPVALNEIIALSGGITERASGEIKIFRPANLSCTGVLKAQRSSDTLTVKIADLLAGKPEANPLIHTGDVVTIEEAAPIFVTGGVAAPQTVYYRNEKMTLTRALASAGGILADADETKIYVYRRLENGETKVFLLDHEKIRKKQDADFELAAFDIIEVSSSRAAERVDQARPPIILNREINESNAQNLPLRVID